VWVHTRSRLRVLIPPFFDLLDDFGSADADDVCAADACAADACADDRFLDAGTASSTEEEARNNSLNST
jgi:hypothetical protein